jgi:diguanylate cyclase (GGDEF)-like protein
MCDIDQFKPYNDHYGHTQGDECLKSVAETLANNPQRTTDLVARYGGEEFAVILSSTDLPGAIQVAERLCQSIRDLAMPHEGIGSQAHVTLSIGVAAMIPTRAQTTTELINQADQHLYYAKEQGRDRWAADTKPRIAFNAQRR